MNIKKEYIKSWKFLEESKNYFAVIIGVLLVSGLIGFLFPVFFIEMIKKFIEEIIAKTENMGFSQLFFYIFQNNIMTAFFGLFLGIFLGLIPLLMTLINGYVLGFVGGITSREFGILTLWVLFPHGIFEIPALIISLGLGLKLGRFVFAKSGKRGRTLRSDLINSFRVFLFIIFPLLLIAGIIESWLIVFLG